MPLDGIVNSQIFTHFRWMKYNHVVGGITYSFPDLKNVLAKATPEKSGDVLAGLAANSEKELTGVQTYANDYGVQEFLLYGVWAEGDHPVDYEMKAGTRFTPLIIEITEE